MTGAEDESSPASERLAERFEAARPRLRGIAQRITGSPADAEDALQESWLRVSRADTATVAHVDGWLTTVVARVCLDILRRRDSRREDLLPDDPRSDAVATAPGEQPEDEAVLADSLGVALHVLLDTLPPPERVAFVLHDLFDVPFAEIAAIVGRSEESARQLASRGRRRVRGAAASPRSPVRPQEQLVRAFLAASRAGNVRDLLVLLDPAATLRADAAVMAMGGAAYWERDDLQTGVSGADAVARTFSRRAQAAVPVLVDGEPGAVWIEDAEVRVLFRFTVAGERITAIAMIGDRAAIERARIER